MTRIAKTFTFEAAHRLQRHDGKCKNLHGHSYRVEVQIEGPIQASAEDTNPQYGMVIDFGRLKEWWRPLELRLDHRTIIESTDPLLRGLIALGVEVTEFYVPPTAENIAEWLKEDLSNWLLGFWTTGFPTPKVRVWETASSWAEA